MWVGNNAIIRSSSASYNTAVHYFMFWLYVPLLQLMTEYIPKYNLKYCLLRSFKLSRHCSPSPLDIKYSPKCSGFPESSINRSRALESGDWKWVLKRPAAFLARIKKFIVNYVDISPDQPGSGRSAFKWSSCSSPVSLFSLSGRCRWWYQYLPYLSKCFCFTLNNAVRFLNNFLSNPDWQPAQINWQKNKTRDFQGKVFGLDWCQTRIKNEIFRQKPVAEAGFKFSFDFLCCALW